MAKRILIVSIKAGAGHLRTAQALEAVLSQPGSGVEVRHIEALEYTNPAFRRSFTATYEKLATDLPSVWGLLYNAMEKKPVASRTKKLAALLDRMNSGPLLAAVEKFGPAAIICTHYFPSEILAARRRKGKLSCQLFTTLTDYDIHTMWIQEGVDAYFVATEEMACALREKGTGASEIHVTGIPLMPAFARKYPAAPAMRSQLGFAPERVTALLSAGGFGLAGIDRTVGLLASAHDNLQLLAVAGRNQKLRKGLEAAAASAGGRVIPFGFVDNMHELMAASDFFVGKCGGLTASECLAMRLPMVILDPIPGQEERNSDFLLESGVALKANTSAHLKYKVGRLLAESGLLARMRRATRSVAKPRAAFDVAEAVCGKIATPA